MGSMMRRHRGLFAVVAAGGLLLGALACDDSETVPPADSTISMAATPSTILLSNGVQVSDIDVLATVYSSIGVPLPGQDVRFTTTSGDLTPLAGNPVETDGIGNAHVILRNARTNTTITAKSGKATADLQLQTATCEIQDILLDLSQITFTQCTGANSSFELTANVTDNDGDPCADITVTFRSTVPAADLPEEDVALVFSPGSVRTDATGNAKTIVSLASDCSTDCVGMDCNTSGQGIVASGGGIESTETGVIIDIN
jgi:hypothetical protein